MRNLKNNSTQSVLFPAKDYGTAASTDGTAVDLKGEGRNILAILTCGALSTSTLKVLIQQSVDNSTWTTLYTFADVTATGAVSVDLTPASRYIRGTVSRATAGSTIIGLVVVIYGERYRPSNVA